MYNGIGGMPSAPIDLLLGFIGLPPTNGATGSDEFGNLLGLFAPTPREGNSLPVPALPFAPNPDLAVVESTQLYLPQDLAEALGLDVQTLPVTIRDGQPPGLIREEHLSSMPIKDGALPQELIKVGRPLSESIRQTLSADNPEPMAQARAGLLSVDDGVHQTLYLKVLPGDIHTDAIRLTPGEGKSEEMVLPMRLRTVEQDGNRIIAEAELQSATGKDIPIRLQLELAGKQNGIQDAIANAAKASEAVNKPSSNGAALSMARLLNNLDVKSMIIEPVEADAKLASKDILPRIVSLPRILGQLRSTGDPSAQINLENDGIGAETKASRVVPSVSGKEGHGLDNASARHYSPSHMPNISIESASSGLTTIPASEVGGLTSPPNADADLTQVRFYNIDQKLDQLKLNPGQRINIQLVPARLGKMELSIVHHRGLITVKLALDSMQAQQAVQRNLPQLESALSSSGIRVDNFQLYVNQPSKGESFVHYQHQFDHPQDGFSGHQGRGFRHYSDNRKQLQQFSLSESGFKQTLVNCLA
jgi:hypothetical protein